MIVRHTVIWANRAHRDKIYSVVQILLAFCFGFVIHSFETIFLIEFTAIHFFCMEFRTFVCETLKHIVRFCIQFHRCQMISQLISLRLSSFNLTFVGWSTGISKMTLICIFRRSYFFLWLLFLFFFFYFLSIFYLFLNM